VTNSEWHASLIHFPIVFLILGFGMDLACLRFRHRALRVAGTLLWVGGLAGVITAIITGIRVQHNARMVLPSLTDFNFHVGLGYALLGTVALAAVIRLTALAMRKNDAATLQAAGGAVAVGLLIAAAFYGGQMVYDDGIGVKKGGVYAATGAAAAEIERTRPSMPSAMDRGAKAYSVLGCAICHGPSGEGARGPELSSEHVLEEFREEHGDLQFSQRLVSDDTVRDIAAWLDTLQPSQQGGGRE
jgi:uncharacterized membrane protein